MNEGERFDDTPARGQPAVGGRAGGRTGALGHRRRRRVRRHRRRAVVGVAALLALAVIGLGAWVEAEASSSQPGGAAVIVHVKPGEAIDTVLGALARDRVVDSPFAFKLWSVLHGQPTMEPGTYQFLRHSSFSLVNAQLDAGPNVFQLDVQPGTTLAEVAKQLVTLPGNLAVRFLREAKTGAVVSPYQPAPGGSLEGLIGVGAYRVTPHERARTLLRAMVARFDAEAAAAGLAPGASVAGLNAYDTVTVASIAQKEGYYTRYMGDVARVVYNRLADGMRLDMTSTVLYSLGQDGGPVTAKEESLTTPYNTYLHAGLTPTPICTPSQAALAAAVSPPAGTWLYFELVTAKKGVMVFSTTYTAQVAAQQQATANSAAAKKTKGASVGSGATHAT